MYKKRSDVVPLAKQLVERLKRSGIIVSAKTGPTLWKVHIWENLGWHYAAVSSCGRWSVHPHTRWRIVAAAKVAGYQAFLNSVRCTGGGIWAMSGKTPEAAIVAVQKRAIEDIQERASALDLEALVPKTGYILAGMQ